jgi:hypothetical protein
MSKATTSWVSGCFKAAKVKHSHYRPMGLGEFWEVKASRFREGGRLSALRSGRLYPQEYPGTHFKRLSRPRAHGIVGCHGKNPHRHHRGSIAGMV